MYCHHPCSRGDGNTMRDRTEGREKDWQFLRKSNHARGNHAIMEIGGSNLRSGNNQHVNNHEGGNQPSARGRSMTWREQQHMSISNLSLSLISLLVSLSFMSQHLNSREMNGEAGFKTKSSSTDQPQPSSANIWTCQDSRMD